MAKDQLHLKLKDIKREILTFPVSKTLFDAWEEMLVKSRATRAEISDVVQGLKAECIMLNKGPHINAAIKVLKNILIRMEPHLFKQKHSLRALNIAKNAVDQLILNP